jgi:hypothetical protein
MISFRRPCRKEASSSFHPEGHGGLKAGRKLDAQRFYFKGCTAAEPLKYD